MNKQLWPTLLQNPPTEPFFSEVPQNIGIAITGRCQLRCRHCFNRSGPDNPHELPLEVIERLLDEMLEWQVRRVRLNGGEPTFHRQFREVVDACNSRNIGIAMNTHGFYSTEMLSYLKTAPIKFFLISVDGMEANNDAIRGRGTFRRAIHSCRELHHAGQNVMISFHVGEGNRTDVAELISLAADIGVNIKVSPIRPVGRAVEELPHSLIQPKNYLQIVQKVTELRRKYSHIKIFTDFDILDGQLDDACQRDAKTASCKAGRIRVNINYDGRIYPCSFFATPKGEFSAGNIYETTVTEAWKTSTVFQPFRIQQKSETCQSCAHYQKKCVGGCPAIAHFTTSYLDSHDPTCFAQLLDPSPTVNI